MALRADASGAVASVTHVTAHRPPAAVPPPARSGLPARARIMAWLLLLLAVALLSVVIVTRNLLLADLDAEITAELQQEDQEFRTFADVGVDPTTGRPFGDAGELLTTHLSRQRPGDDEVQVGVFADGSSPQAQGRQRLREAMTAGVLATILGATTDTGEAVTPEGPVRWTRTLVDRDVDVVDGYFPLHLAAICDEPADEATARRLVALVLGGAR